VTQGNNRSIAPLWRYTDPMKLFRILLLGMAVCVFSLSVAAQWQWVDKSGRKVFSDRPPPPEIPDKSILQHGGKRSADQVSIPSQSPPGTDSTNGTAATTGSATNDASTTKPASLDKQLADRKRQAVELEAAKRKAEEEKTAQTRAENCDRAKRAKTNFESGTRVFRTNDQGEREVLDETARAAEIQRLQSIIDSDCR
jgi:hypothetical protein